MSDIELSVKLDTWIDDNTVDGDFIAHPDFVYDKLLELEAEIKSLQAENAELKNREHELSSAIKDIPDKVDSSLHLKGLDRPTEFAISQAKTRAIGAVMDKVRSAKKLTKGE